MTRANSGMTFSAARRLALVLAAGIWSAVPGDVAMGEPLLPGSCFEEWSQAAEFVRREGMPSLDEVTVKDQRFDNVRIVKALLCRNDDGYAYRFVVQDRGGGLRQFSVETKVK